MYLSPRLNNYSSQSFSRNNFGSFSPKLNSERSVENINPISPHRHTCLHNFSHFSPCSNFSTAVCGPSSCFGNVEKVCQAAEISHNGIINKINKLSTDLFDTQINLRNKIDGLHEHLCLAERKTKDEMIEMNSKNLNEISVISGEKEGMIKQLKCIIADQRELINKLKERNQELEIELIETKKLKEQYAEDKLALRNDKVTQEDFYNKKINELNKMHQEDKQKIMAQYEMQIEKINDNYRQNKEKMMDMIKERESQLNSLITNTKSEREEFNGMISKLKSENEAQNASNSDLNKFNEELQSTIAGLNEQLEIVKGKFEETNKDNGDLMEKLNMLKRQNKEFKRTNTQLHNVVYGRFNKSKSKGKI